MKTELMDQPDTPTELESNAGKSLAAAAKDRGKSSYSTAMMIIRFVVIFMECISQCL
jgi:hypothetical protein